VAGFEVISGLFETFLTAALHFHSNNPKHKHQSVLRLLPEENMIALKQAQNAYGVSMCIIDFVTSMTDRYALSLYRKIKGIALPGQ
jgi:dGTPase